MATWTEGAKLRDVGDALTQPSPAWIASLAPRFTGDSGDTPIAVLLQNDSDIADSTCGHCFREAKDWPYTRPNFTRPAAMYQAELYCADCFDFAFDDTGAIVRTLTGESE